MIETDQLNALLMPFVSALIALVFTLWFKNLAEKIAKGLAFKMNGAFKQGEKVILDGQHSVIISIGITQTIFASQVDSDTVWRYVPNERIPWLKLEKIIR